MPLDGDMSEIILTTQNSGYYEVLHDPFGLNVLLNNKIYANPNRFFAHWTTSEYFLNMPFLLQNFVSPIESIYLSCAIAKTFIQILILYLLSVYISNTKNIFKKDFLIAAVLITPLFQTSGYGRFIGIIDQSMIYTIFYALPLGLLLIFFRPFYNNLDYNNAPNIHFVIKILLIFLSVFLTLNGPLVPGVILIICMLIFFNIWSKNYRQQNHIKQFFKKILLSIKAPSNFATFCFVAISILSLYSLYIGHNNSLNFTDLIPLSERYTRLPAGIYYLLTQKLGYTLFLLMIAINITIIKKNYPSVEGKKILHFIKWIGVFSILYILLLPLGGFRIYRSNIIRYDTIMPVTIALIFVYGITSFYLIKMVSVKYKKIYLLGLIVFLSVFTCADKLETKNFTCEKQALETLAQSHEKIVALNCDCPIMDWRKIYDSKLSTLNAELFYYWNITKDKKLYFYKK